MMESNNSVSKLSSIQNVDVVILSGDDSVLRSMGDVLRLNGYKVKLVHSIVEAFYYLKNHTPRLVIISQDLYMVSAANVYNRMSETLRSKGIRSFMLDRVLFSNELLERVEKALE